MNLPLDIPIMDFHVRAYPAEVGRRTQMAMGRKNPPYDGTPEEYLDLLAQVSTNKASGAVLKNVTPTGEMAKAAWDRVDRRLTPEEEHEMYGSVQEMIAGRIRRRNAWGNDVTRQYPTLLNFIGVDPNFLSPQENVEELEVRVKEGARGISLHPTRNLHQPADRRLWPLYERAQEMGVPFIAHSGTEGFHLAYTGLNSRPVDFVEVLDSFPRLRIVLGHMGRGYFDDAIEIAHRYPNVYFDISGFDEASSHNYSDEEFVQLIRRFGSENLVFASGWVFGDFLERVKHLASLPMTDNEKERIFYRNAQEFLGT